MSRLDTILRRWGWRLVRWGESLLARTEATREDVVDAKAMDAKTFWAQKVADVPEGAWQRFDASAPVAGPAAPKLRTPARPPHWPGTVHRRTTNQANSGWPRSVAQVDASAERPAPAYPPSAPAADARARRPLWTSVVKGARQAMRYLGAIVPALHTVSTTFVRHLPPSIVRRMPPALDRNTARVRVTTQPARANTAHHPAPARTHAWPVSRKPVTESHRPGLHDIAKEPAPSRRADAQVRPGSPSPAPRHASPLHAEATLAMQSQAWTPPWRHAATSARWPASNSALGALARPRPASSSLEDIHPRGASRPSTWPALSQRRSTFLPEVFPDSDAGEGTMQWPELPPWPVDAPTGASRDRMAAARRLRRLEREHAEPDPRRSGRD